MHLQHSRSRNLLRQYLAHHSNTAESVTEYFVEGWSDIYKFFLTITILVKTKYLCSNFILVQSKISTMWQGEQASVQVRESDTSHRTIV